MESSSHIAKSVHRSAKAVLTCCEELSHYTETPGSIQRTFLSEPTHEVHRHLGAWMGRLGMSVWVDAIVNLRGVYAGAGAKRLIIGSHLDTVPNGGAYDGVIGVVIGIALIELLGGERLAHTIEIIGFSEEEGVRFGVPFLGSRAMAGTFDRALLDRLDRAGVSVADAIRSFGLDPARIENAELDADTAAYLEIHIEQGPVLEKACLALGAVEAIAGQTRAGVTFLGKSNHAGTTPMAFRRDALCAAAEWILAVEREARRTPGLVATVGKIEASPGVANVISGEVLATIDVRHSVDQPRERAFAAIVSSGYEIAHRRGLSFHHDVRLNQAAVPMNAELVALVVESIAATGEPPMLMASGAGHDAMILAARVPSAMIFVRSPGGISHHRDETVLLEDVQTALTAGSYFLRKLTL